MFSLMGNCVSCIKKRNEPKKSLTLAILGLDCAGKTTATKCLTGEELDNDVAPTVGFNSEKFTVGKFNITLFDLGGGKQIRAVWTTYLPEVYGIIYMIDSTACERMSELKINFRDLVENGKVAGKPILVLANKQDKEDALDEMDIIEQLQMENTVNRFQCPCKVESCSAIKGTGRKMDPVIKNGLLWLCESIDSNYEQLQQRVDADMAEAEKERKIEAAARRERVRIMREEKAIQEEEERKRLGIEQVQSEEDDVIEGDPFKRVDIKELEKKEARMKEEKKKLKELRARADQKDVLSKIGDGIKTPRSNRLQEMGEKSTDDSDSIANSNMSNRSSRMLPPLQEPLGTKFVEETNVIKKKKKKKKVKQNDLISGSLGGMGDMENLQDASLLLVESSTQKSNRSVSKVEVMTNDNVNSSRSFRAGLTPVDGCEEVNSLRKKNKGPLEIQNSNNSNIYELQDVSDLKVSPRRPLPVPSPSADVPETKIKKMRKKKSKRNHISPTELDADPELVKQARGDYSSRNYPWETPDRILDESDAVENEIKPYKEDLSTKWGLAEDLGIPEPVLRTRPNYDDDDDIVL